jgi:hypothetical protein
MRVNEHFESIFEAQWILSAAPHEGFYNSFLD